jgi:hypothetical protein
MRRIRLDEDDLRDYLTPLLAEQGYIKDDHEILGFEYRTRTIKRGGDYYRDEVKSGDAPPPEGVEVIRWIKVLVGPPKRTRREEERSEAEAPEPEPDDSETPSVVE